MTTEALLMAQARDLLTTYEANVKRDGVPAAREWLEGALRKVPRLYGAGSDGLVRKYMRIVKDEERMGV